jgi:pimeloyl-ACP methyl ester carboxylesterase
MIQPKFVIVITTNLTSFTKKLIHVFNARYIVATAGMVLFTGCTMLDTLGRSTHRPYRIDQPVARVAGQTMIGFLEFDDQGEPWRKGWEDRQSQEAAGMGEIQLGAVLNSIRELKKNGPIRTVVYIHGWNNNAEEGNRDLDNFKYALKWLSKASDDPVFGVYVSWRGRVFGTGTGIDFASREAAAGRIAGGPLLSSLRAISTATHQGNQGHSRVTVIGHSYGAKILVNITSAHLAAQFGNRFGDPDPDSEIAPMADTVILANTAESGRVPRHLIGMMRDYKVTHENKSNGRKLPLIVAITSDGDWATRKVLPIGNIFLRDVFGSPDKGGSTSSKNQKHSLYNALGFEAQFQSHVMNDGDHRANGGKIEWKRELEWEHLIRDNFKLGATVPGNGAEFYTKLTPTGKPEDARNFEVVRNYLAVEEHRPGTPHNETPFWAIQVPKYVVKDHNGIWNPNFLGMIAAVEGMGQEESKPTDLKSNKAETRVTASP